MKAINRFTVYSVYSLILFLILFCASSVSAKKDKEPLRENYTKIINNGDGELKAAIVYYNRDKGELFQKGWFTIQPGAEVELPFDVYYIYAYDIDIYGDYEKFTGNHYFKIDDDDFEGSAMMGREGEIRSKGFIQTFKGKTVPAEKPPDDVISIKYKPDKDIQNHTKVINQGNSEIKFAIVYYDYNKSELIQKGWYTIAPNSIEELPVDVYYIYAYETDLYGDYIRLADKEYHLKIPDADFEGTSEVCGQDEGYGFKQWFNGKDVPAKTPPKDEIKIYYLPEKSQQNITRIVNNGGSEIRFAITYFDYDRSELIQKGWYTIAPNSPMELPVDVYHIYAYETDLYGNYVRLSGNKDYFRITEEDFESAADMCGQNAGCGFSQWFSGKNIPAVIPPKDELKISYKQEKYQQNFTRIVNKGNSEIKYAVTYFDYEKSELLQKGWYIIAPNSTEELPVDVYHIYAYETDLYGDYIRLTGNKNYFKIPEEEFESAAEMCVSGEGYGLRQWFPGKAIPSLTPPKDDIIIAYKPEKTKQNYTRVTNMGDRQLSYAIVYYDYTERQLLQKGWFILEPNSTEDLPYDVYYHYGYITDHYGDYVKIYGEDYFDVPYEDFEGAAEKCDQSLGLGFGRWFNGNDIPAIKPPKDEIKIFYTQEEFKQNFTKIVNFGLGELNASIVYYDWANEELIQQQWLILEPQSALDIPNDVFFIYAYEEDDNGEWFNIVGDNNYSFYCPEGDFEGSIEPCAPGTEGSRGFAKIFTKQKKSESFVPPRDEIMIVNKSPMEKARAKASALEAKRKKGNNYTRIHNRGGGTLNYVIVYFNEEEKQLYQKGWFHQRPHTYKDIPYDVYYIYADEDESSGNFFINSLTNKKGIYFKIPKGDFDEPAVSCVKRQSRVNRGFKQIFKGKMIPAMKPPKDHIKAVYMTKEERIAEQKRRAEAARKYEEYMAAEKARQDTVIPGWKIMMNASKARGDAHEARMKAQEEQEERERLAEEKRKREQQQQAEARKQEEERRKKQIAREAARAIKKATKKVGKDYSDAKKKFAQNAPSPAGKGEIWVRNLHTEPLDIAVVYTYKYWGYPYSFADKQILLSGEKLIGWQKVLPGKQKCIVSGAYGKAGRCYWYAKSDTREWKGVEGYRESYAVPPEKSFDESIRSRSKLSKKKKREGYKILHFSEKKTNADGSALIIID